MNLFRYIALGATLSAVLIPSLLLGETPSHNLSGEVIFTDKTPVHKAIVILFPKGYADTTDVSGSFSFNSLPSGSYILAVSHPSLGLKDVHKSVTIPRATDESIIIVMENRTYEVDEVVVVSKRAEPAGKEEKETPSFVTIVERSDFEKKAATVADVITATPSASITSTGGLGDYSEVSLRGSYSNQVQVYLDGMLLNEAVGGAVNLGTIPLSDVERVETWRSGAPARFGGDSSGGVINISTRDIREPHRTFSLGYGSFNTMNASAVFTIPREMSRFHMTLDYSASDNEFEYKSGNGTMYNKEDDYWARRNNDEFRSANLLSKYSRLFGNGVMLECSEHILSNNKNLPGKENVRRSNASLEAVKNLFQVKMTLPPFWRNSVEFQPSLYHIYSHERYRDPKGNVGWGIQDNTYQTYTFNASAPFTVNLGEYARFDVTSTARHESFKPESKIQKNTMLTCEREHEAAVVDALLTPWGDRLSVSSTFRRDRFFSSFSGQPSVLNRNPPKSRFHYTTTTRAGLKLSVTRSISIQTSYGDFTRVPSLFELFGDRGRTVSNPDLKPEHTIRRDAGMKIRTSRYAGFITGSFEYAYFDSRFKNLIQWYTNDAGFVHPENVGGSYIKGSELIWTGKFLGRLVCSGNWTFQESKVTKELRKYYRNKKLPNRPEGYGTVTFELPWKAFTLFWMMNTKSSYYLDRANQAHKKYQGRTLQDIGVTASLKNGTVTCNVIARNITDVHTFDIQGMPKPGRSYMVTVTCTMK